jgi:8-oxo-dGTP diphosphatase
MSARIQVAAAAILRTVDGNVEILSARRTEPRELRGGWEFPGGKLDPGEDAETAMHREVLEELGVELKILHFLSGPENDASWPMGERYALNVFICELTGDKQPEILEQHDEIRWLALDQAYSVPWLEVDLPPLAAVIEWSKQNSSVSQKD